MKKIPLKWIVKPEEKAHFKSTIKYALDEPLFAKSLSFEEFPTTMRCIFLLALVGLSAIDELEQHIEN